MYNGIFKEKMNESVKNMRVGIIFKEEDLFEEATKIASNNLSVCLTATPDRNKGQGKEAYFKYINHYNPSKADSIIRVSFYEPAYKIHKRDRLGLEHWELSSKDKRILQRILTDHPIKYIKNLESFLVENIDNCYQYLIYLYNDFMGFSNDQIFANYNGDDDPTKPDDLIWIKREIPDYTVVNWKEI